MNRLHKAAITISRFSKRLGTLNGLAVYLKIAVSKRFPGAADRVISLRIPQADREIYLRPKTTDAHTFHQVFIGGDYDFPVAHEPKFIVDAGAHIGFATLYLKHRFPGVRIVAIEPEPSNARMLARNTGGHDDVIVHQAALWNTHGQVRIQNPEADSWSFRVEGADDAKGGVAAITIYDILEESPYIDILKLDIEGAEKELFSGDTEWLRQVGMIVMEFHERYAPGSTAMINEVMDRFGFRKIMEKGENAIYQAAKPAAA